MGENLINLWVKSFNAKPLVSIQEAADLVNVHENTIRKAVDNGTLKACRLGSKLIRIGLPDLESWLLAGDKLDETENVAWVPNGPPIEFKTVRILFKVIPGKPIELIYPIEKIRHPFCLKRITIGLKPIICNVESAHSHEMLQEFGRIQSRFNSLYINIDMLKALSVAACTPSQKDVQWNDPGTTPKDTIWMCPTYDSKASGVSGHEFQDNELCFKPGPLPHLEFCGTVEAEEAKHIDVIPGQIELSLGMYGW